MSHETKKLSYKSTNYRLIRNRELGLKHFVGRDDDIARKIYSNIGLFKNKSPRPNHKVNGGIFNLEFSLDGGLLVAACEEKSILIYDASNQQIISQVKEAHDKCVNCVRFIDHYSFATCSDDGSIKIWDTRKFTTWKRTLHGHTNWVKNIEYSDKDRIMITSAFDGTVCAWDLNQPSDHIVEHNKLFTMNGLMRTKLSPDGTKMIIASTSGFMMIIHDLNLQTLYKDTKNFKPIFYRLMQLSEERFPAALMFNSLFSQSRTKNRIEFIDDFPNEAEIISSLQIHPMGWSALSRNSSGYDNLEYTCVHDIQTRDPRDYEDAYIIPELSDISTDISISGFPNLPLPSSPSHPSSSSSTSSSLVTPTLLSTSTQTTTPSSSGSSTSFNTTPSPAPSTNRQANSDGISDTMPVADGGNVGLDNDIWLGFVTHEMLDNDHHPAIQRLSSGLLDPRSFGHKYFTQNPGDRYRIVKNLPRMTHYIQELNTGQGFIKELCFSTDGRLMCSPYDNGVRLLAFNEHLQEVSYCLPDKPRELYVLSKMKYHKAVVVSCKFNPRHYELVSGCLDGEIVWYKPIL